MPVDTIRRITTSAKSKTGAIAYRSAAAISMAAKLNPGSRLTSPAHLKSAQKAAKAFEKFSLSKFARGKTPENYIGTRKANDAKAVQPKTVQEVQKALISRQLRKLPDTDTENSGITITFPVAQLEEVKKVLPGMGQHGGKVKLDDLLTYLRGRMNGTTFYSRGNPMMKRLIAEVQARSQARAMIERVKKRSGEKRADAAPSGATQTAAASNDSPDVLVSRKKGRLKS